MKKDFHYIISENKKNTKLIINHIASLKNQLSEINKNIKDFKNNNINIQEIRHDNGRYFGQVVNGLAEGRGIKYYDNRNRYEGEYRNDKKEGKGIFYWNDGDRYEGDFKNGKREGKGIMYYNNGDREMGNYSNGTKIGKHVKLHADGSISSNVY